MTTVNFYAAAIDILMHEDIDYKMIVVELVKHDPGMFLNICQNMRDYQPWLPEVDASLRAHKKIDAIKLWRHHTGLGLKEAKDAVEARIIEIGLEWDR